MKSLTIVFVICFSTFISNNASAQIFPGENGKSLKGLDTFDLHVVIQSWIRMGEYSQENYQSVTQRIAKNMLTKNGIEVSQRAPNYLLCFVKVLGSEDHLQATYSIHTAYFQYSPSDLHILHWDSSVFGYAGMSNFKFEDVARFCIGNFIAEWNEYN